MSIKPIQNMKVGVIFSVVLTTFLSACSKGEGSSDSVSAPPFQSEEIPSVSPENILATVNPFLPDERYQETVQLYRFTCDSEGAEQQISDNSNYSCIRVITPTDTQYTRAAMFVTLDGSLLGVPVTPGCPQSSTITRLDRINIDCTANWLLVYEGEVNVFQIGLFYRNEAGLIEVSYQINP